MAHDSTTDQSSGIDDLPDFPINWATPSDAQTYWEQEAVHFPDPMTPMDRDFSALKITEGFNQGAAYYGLPIEQRLRDINTYAYIANVPLGPAPDAAGGGVDEEKLKATMATLGDLWDQEWLPDIQQHLTYWAEFNLREADLPALRQHLDETVRRVRLMWEIHFRLAFPMLMAITFFEEMHQDLFEDTNPLDAYALLTEVENTTVKSSRALWELSRHALSEPVVRQALERHASETVIDSLSESPKAQGFLAEMEAYLQAYGQRIDKLYVSVPTWRENPVPLINNMKGYMAQPDRDLLGEMEATIADREQAVANARERLGSFPQPVVEQFEFLLKTAQKACYLKEEHTNWIDFQTTYHARQVVLECGRRLQDAAAIENRDDVFYLTLDELQALMAAEPLAPQQARVSERRALEAQYADCTPPPSLGAPPSGPPPDNPVVRAVSKVFGAPPPTSETPGELLGLGASPGTVRGTARILHSLAEVDKLEPGDILVAATTTPPWTPLFANIVGVITDAGGILSHPAVVAREYGIPAVVGTGRSTSVIKDGQVVEIDGDKGVVRLVS
jgi:pyruvate,water dikinase